MYKQGLFGLLSWFFTPVRLYADAGETEGGPTGMDDDSPEAQTTSEADQFAVDSYLNSLVGYFGVDVANIAADQLDVDFDAYDYGDSFRTKAMDEYERGYTQAGISYGNAFSSQFSDAFDTNIGLGIVQDTAFGFDTDYHTVNGVQVGMFTELALDLADTLDMQISVEVAGAMNTLESIYSAVMTANTLLGFANLAGNYSALKNVVGSARALGMIAQTGIGVYAGIQNAAKSFGVEVGVNTNEISSYDVDSSLSSGSSILLASDNELLREIGSIYESSFISFSDINDMISDHNDYMAGGSLYNAKLAGDMLFNATEVNDPESIMDRKLGLTEESKAFLFGASVVYENLLPLKYKDLAEDYRITGISLVRQVELKEIDVKSKEYDKMIAEYNEEYSIAKNSAVASSALRQALNSTVTTISYSDIYLDDKKYRLDIQGGNENLDPSAILTEYKSLESDKLLAGSEPEVIYEGTSREGLIEAVDARFDVSYVSDPESRYGADTEGNYFETPFEDAWDSTKNEFSNPAKIKIDEYGADIQKEIDDFASKYS